MIVSAPPRRRRRRRRRGSTAESRPATLPARSAAGNGHRRGCAFGQPCPSHSTSYSGSNSKSARGRHFRSDRLSTKSRRIAAQSVVPHDRHRRWSGGDRGTNRMLPAKPHRFSHGSCRAYSMAVIQRIATVAERPLCARSSRSIADRTLDPLISSRSLGWFTYLGRPPFLWARVPIGLGPGNH